MKMCKKIEVKMKEKFQILILVIIAIIEYICGKDIYVCEAGNKSFLGKYSPLEVNGLITYKNDKGMSFFKSRGHWFLGDLK
jgi:hypothetical protein